MRAHSLGEGRPEERLERAWRRALAACEGTAQWRADRGDARIERSAEISSMDANLDPPPLPRPRSNTWPLPRPENFADVVVKEEAGARAALGGGVFAGPQGAAAAAAKKNSSRRNAWGNLSYADLITQAITSAPDKRLTLSQIYEWMVHNVPYFKDKGDSNSSAGWKNSIRHNLSLHNRFMRVQNEGTGKSSWWMINPDAKPGKSARRRATSMETSKFEKRRGRVKKKVEQLRAAGADATPSPSSSVSEGLDLFPDSPLHAGFQLSPDFRPRASSNASSCGGRLSPIPAAMGAADWGAYGPEQLAGSLAESMKIHHDYLYQPPPYLPPPQQPPPQQQPQQQQQPPPPYHHQQQQQQPPPPPPPPPPTPCTMMGQLMASLNNPALLDDLNLNIETLHGFDCNVDEVIKHELSMDGSLDFNFSAAAAAHHHLQQQQQHQHQQQLLPQHQQHLLQQQQQQQAGPAAPEQQRAPPPGPYASGPSWVH